MRAPKRTTPHPEENAAVRRKLEAIVIQEDAKSEKKKDQQKSVEEMVLAMRKLRASTKYKCVLCLADSHDTLQCVKMPGIAADLRGAQGRRPQLRVVAPLGREAPVPAER